MYPILAPLKNSLSGNSRFFASAVAISSLRHPSNVVTQISSNPWVSSRASERLSIVRLSRNSPACRFRSIPMSFTSTKNAVELRMRLSPAKFAAMARTPSPAFTRNVTGVVSLGSTARSLSNHQANAPPEVNSTTRKNTMTRVVTALLDFMEKRPAIFFRRGVIHIYTSA